MQPFRFGFQNTSRDLEAMLSGAKRAEEAGFDVFQTSDHVSPGWSPLMPLAAAAAVTTTLRLGTLVINNDFRHPVQLARDVADLDHLSGGRVELGMGAGHSFDEYAAIGATFDAPSVRKARLAESLQIMRQLLDGETTSWQGEHYRLDNVTTKRSLQDRLPIMAAVNGVSPLAHAAEHADIIGLMMLGRTLADGHNHEVRWQADRLDRTVAHIRASAGPRGVPELNALVQVVEITDDREGFVQSFVDEVEGLSLDDALTTPFIAIGTEEQIAQQWIAARERWGINYFSVRAIEPLAPVIERLRAYDAKR